MESDQTSREEVQATFRFVGDNVNPKMLTSRMGIQPSVAHAKGDTVEKHPDRTYLTGYWGLDSSVLSDQSLEEHLKHLLDALEPYASIIKELRKDGFFPSFFCGIFIIEAGLGTFIKLEPTTLGRMADIGVPLELRVYCCEEDEF